MSEYLTPEEREEYDALMFEAGCTADGKPRPSHEIGARVVAALREAANQAHRPWARYVLDDLVTAGALGRWKRWHKRRVVVEVGSGKAKKTVIVTHAAVMAVKRRDADTGRQYFQQTFWVDMTRPELEQIIQRANTQVRGERRTIALAKRLLVLMDRVPEANTAAEAAAAIGTTVNEYLAAPAVAA